MTDTFYITQGDTTPVLGAQLTNDDGSPMNLSDSTVRLVLAEPRGGEVLIDGECALADVDNGEVHYLWSDGELPDQGRYRAQLTVEHDSTGKRKSVPQDGFKTVFVSESLD